MAKRRRTVVDDVDEFTAAENRRNYKEAQTALKKRCQARPGQAAIFRSLIQGGPVSADDDDAAPNEDKKMVTPSNGVMSKFPLRDQRLLLTQCFPNISEAHKKMWKATDPQIERNLFEFEFCMADTHPWPQGPCHVPEAMLKVLPAWVAHLESKHHMKPRLSGLQAHHLITPAFDWATFGVYAFAPADAETKTSIVHRSLGAERPLPKSLLKAGVTNQWTIANNWSFKYAYIRDAEGAKMMPVSSFFKPEETPYSAKHWVDFATDYALRLQEQGSDDAGEADIIASMNAPQPESEPTAARKAKL